MKEVRSFEEFTKEVTEKIREFLPEKFASADISLQMIRKNNDLQLTGLNISSAETNICPTIYLEKFYEEYQNGEEISEILSKIADIRINNEVSEKFDVSQIMEWEQAKKKIVPRLVNAQMNKEWLANRPYKLIEDLAVTYYFLVDHSEEETASISVSEQFMSQWDISIEELHQIAVENMKEAFPSSFRGMMEVMKELMGVSKEEMEMMGIATEKEQMYVLTNSAKLYGAAAILDTELMEYIVNRLGDIYIIPSSVHEIIIVPDDVNIDVESFEDMINEVNETQVKLEERLGVHAYRYTLKDGLKIA